MKRVTATWTVITNPFVFLAQIANPFERIRKERPAAGIHDYKHAMEIRLSLSWGGVDL